jgi:RimJ/RimL family protein N-acetyltransferase
MTILDHIDLGGLRLDRVTAHDEANLRQLFAAPGMADFLPPAADHADPVAAQLHADLDHWRAHGIGRYLIRQGDAAVGVAGLTDKPPFSGWNLSYHITPEARGLGHATTAATALIMAAQGLRPMRRVYALILPPNPASERVLEKLGFIPGEPVDYGGRPATRWIDPREDPYHEG